MLHVLLFPHRLQLPAQQLMLDAYSPQLLARLLHVPLLVRPQPLIASPETIAF
jgi:hypothetical protein